jgi:protein-tyrosine-phosphatase
LAPRDRPAAVLFVCNLNRVRSPMAMALARRLLGPAVYADSCGLTAAEELDGFAQAALQEVGIELADFEPKTLEAVRDAPFDLVVSLTPEAHASVRHLPTATEFWPTEDPTLQTGSREQRLDAYRAVRDALSRRLRERFAGVSTPAG